MTTAKRGETAPRTTRLSEQTREQWAACGRPRARRESPQNLRFCTFVC